LGNYYNIHENHKIIAVTGERTQMKDFIEFGSIKMLNGALKKGAAYISENLLIISFNLNGNKIFF
jgi:hypothetical protein